jgi:hypothetical protein
MERWLPRSRAILLLIVGGYFLALLALGGRQHWAPLGVTPGHLPFGDLRSITSGWECTRRGIDVLPANPCDPSGKPANYPRIWMSPAFLGLGQGSTVVLGILVGAIFLVAAIAVLPADARPREAVLYALALCSPAVMLGVERGNVDILIFALVVLAILLFRRSERSRLVAHLLMLFAAVLKLFPIFAAGVLLRQPRRRALIGLGALVACFALYAFAIRADLRTLVRVTPQSNDFSYGIRLFSQWLANVATKIGGSTVGRLPLRAWDDALALLIVGSAVLLRKNGRGRTPQTAGPSAERDLDLFVAGAGVYICSYVLLRNFDYRLAYLLLTLPQLFRWARDGQRLAVVSLAALFGTLWFDADLTVDVPLLGSALRHWNKLTTLGVFSGTLPAAVIAQLVLFAGLVGSLVAIIPAGVAEARFRRRTVRATAGRN